MKICKELKEPCTIIASTLILVVVTIILLMSAGV